MRAISAVTHLTPIVPVSAVTIHAGDMRGASLTVNMKGTDLVERRWEPIVRRIRTIIISISLNLRRSLAFGLLFLLMGCAGQFSGPPPPSQTAQLCKSWGYAPNDPECLKTFRRDPPNH